MSSVLLPVALLATFGAVLVAALSLESSRRVRRKTTELLQAQVGDASVPAQREQVLAKPVAERIVLPMLGAFGAIGRKITPAETKRRLDHKLMLAGSPAGWDAEKVVAFEVVGLATLPLIGWGLPEGAPLHGPG